MHSMLLLQLEDALVIQVLLRLDRYSLCVFSRSCRECFRLSTDNQLWYTHTLTQLAPQHRARPPPAAAVPGYWRSVYCCWHGAAFRAPVAQLHGTRQRMISAVCIDNSSRCWVGDDAGSLQLWDLTRAPEGGTALSSDAVTVIHGHKAGVNCVSLSCEPGWSVISGGADRALRGWDNRTNAVAFELEDAMHDEIFCIQACQNQIAVGGADVDTKLYDARKMHSGPVGIFEGASDTVVSLPVAVYGQSINVVLARCMHCALIAGSCSSHVVSQLIIAREVYSGHLSLCCRRRQATKQIQHG